MKIYNLFLAATLALGLASCGAKQETAAETTEPAATEEVAETQAEATAQTAVIDLAEDQSIAKGDGKLVVIDFNATWCPPCKQFAPNFHAVAEKNADKAVFYSVDVDKHGELAKQYNVESIPTIVYIKADGTTDRTVGYMDEAQFAEAVAAHL